MRQLSLDDDLAALGGRRVLLVFDFDGVLVPLTERASEVAMRPQTRALLQVLTSQVDCAVLSGRSLRDLRRFVGAIPFRTLVGNHGVEWDGRPVANARELVKQVRTWKRQLAPLARDGIELELKLFSLSVHYRRAARRAEARRAILAACAKLTGARLVPGKLVVNLVGAASRNKGAALLALWQAYKAKAVLFVGDDTTDEDVFELNSPSLLTIRIGRSARSRAAFYIDGQRKIDSLLKGLARITAPQSLTKRGRSGRARRR